MLKKAKAFFVKIGKKGKAMLFTTIAAVSMLAMTVAASAAEVAETGDGTSTIDISTLLSGAGDKLMESFNSLIQTMIPVLLGIAGGGLVVFALIALFGLAKKIFGKVTG